MSTSIRIALIDLYEGIPNQGIRAITECVDDLVVRNAGIDFVFDSYDTRVSSEVPGLDYDIYISSGGPGSPFDGMDSEWERKYFELVENIFQHNEASGPAQRKHILFICHSFQLMCRHFDLGRVTERHTPSFGILKVHKTKPGAADPLFHGLRDPFYAGDFRSFQVVEPNQQKMNELDATIIAMEKERPHVPYERAVMGIRISDEMVGVQFHPEADPPGMRVHFQQPDRKAEIIEKYSSEKYEQIMDRLDDPDYLEATHVAILPNFFAGALKNLLPSLESVHAE